MSDWKKTQCNFCQVSCGLEVQVENNHIVNVRPDPDSPRSPHTYCCRKGRSAKYFVDNEDRLDYPMKKVGDHFERISWDQAFQEIGEKIRALLAKYGPKAFFKVGPGNASGQAPAILVRQLCGAIGTQYGYGPFGIEFMGFYWTMGKIHGTQAKFIEPDEKNCDVLIFWGGNSYVSHNFAEARKIIREFSENPDKMVIVVDPRLSETARMSDMHIMPKHGTDALVMKGLIAMILEKGWQNQEFIDKWVLDFDRIKPWFEGFDYKKAFEVAQIPLEQMVELAKIMTSRSWGVHLDLGVYMNRHSTACSYLSCILMAITGNLLKQGNVILEPYILMGNPSNENDPNTWRTPETGRFPVMGTYPSGVLAAELLSEREDRHRVMLCIDSNMARSYPDSNAIAEGIKRLELSVVIDMCMTETARLADYVLPGKTHFETYDFNMFNMSYPEVVCCLKHPVISQIAERKEDGEILLGIGKAMGFVPELPQELYDIAEKAVAERDRVPYMLAVKNYLGKNPQYAGLMLFIVAETLGKAMGSVHKACLWVGLMGSPLAKTDYVQRAGFAPDPKYAALGPAAAGLSMMDQVFQKVDDTPQGVVIALPDYENREKYTYEAISYEDHKFHLWCIEIEENLQLITPEKEKAALELDAEYPFLLSSGRHAEAGVNNMMRNSDTYVYRKPYVAYMNPQDVEEMGFKDGQEIRVTTKAGSIVVPILAEWSAARGYVQVPHHFGLMHNGEVYGSGANTLSIANDIEEVTGNPHLRYVPCRIESV